MNRPIRYPQLQPGSCVPHSLANLLNVPPTRFDKPRIGNHTFQQASEMLGKWKDGMGLEVVYRNPLHPTQLTKDLLVLLHIPCYSSNINKKVLLLLEILTGSGERHAVGGWLHLGDYEQSYAVDPTRPLTQSFDSIQRLVGIAVGTDKGRIALFD